MSITTAARRAAENLCSAFALAVSAGATLSSTAGGTRMTKRLDALSRAVSNLAAGPATSRTTWVPDGLDSVYTGGFDHLDWSLSQAARTSHELGVCCRPGTPVQECPHVQDALLAAASDKTGPEYDRWAAELERLTLH